MDKLFKAGFSSLNAEHDAKFISYKEAMEKLLLESGDTYREVAIALRRLRMR